jgi:hypothetical protein
MTSNCKFMTHARLLALLISPFLLAGACACRAQAMPPERSIYVLGANGLDSAAAPASALTDQPPAADPTASSPAPATVEYPEWHFSVSPYLWFPGVHGTVSVREHPVYRELGHSSARSPEIATPGLCLPVSQ